MYRLIKYFFEILMMFIVYVLCDAPGSKKYILIVLLTLYFLIAGRKKQWSVDAIICVFLPVIVYFFSGLIGTFINASEYIETIKTIIFWLIP